MVALMIISLVGVFALEAIRLWYITVDLRKSRAHFVASLPLRASSMGYYKSKQEFSDPDRGFYRVLQTKPTLRKIQIRKN